MSYFDNNGLDMRTLKSVVESILGHEVHQSNSQDGTRFSYGHARAWVPAPHHNFKGVVWTRPEGKGFELGDRGEENFVSTEIPSWRSVVAKIIAGCLATGRTVECGPGIGMFGPKGGRDHGGWNWHIDDRGTDMGWEHLLQHIEGRGTREEPWDLAPDYQRGAVWTKDQQERFIGHVLAGGKVLPIYVQRYESSENAPKGTNYLRLPCEVIDGQQRLRAIMAFLKGDCGAKVYHDGEWHTYFYSQMNEQERSEINGLGGQRVNFVDLPRKDRLRFYLRLNGGTPHTEAELDKVRRMLIEETA